MRNVCCKACGRELTPDEIGLHRKLYSRAAAEYFCIDCSAAYLEVSRELLEQKILQFKAAGCTLFPKSE